MTIKMTDHSKQSLYDKKKDDVKQPCKLISDFCRSISELVTSSNLQGIHERYQAVLDILVNNQCSLTEAMRQFNIPHNTLRDYIGICELQIIDGGGYKRVVEAERQKMGKISAKSIELRCRAVLNEYRVQANTLKQQKKLLPFYPKEVFYTSK